jgi:hypothetical protein
VDGHRRPRGGARRARAAGARSTRRASSATGNSTDPATRGRGGPPGATRVTSSFLPRPAVSLAGRRSHHPRALGEHPTPPASGETPDRAASPRPPPRPASYPVGRARAPLGTRCLLLLARGRPSRADIAGGKTTASEPASSSYCVRRHRRLILQVPLSVDVVLGEPRHRQDAEPAQTETPVASSTIPRRRRPRRRGGRPSRS